MRARVVLVAVVAVASGRRACAFVPALRRALARLGGDPPAPEVDGAVDDDALPPLFNVRRARRVVEPSHASPLALPPGGRFVEEADVVLASSTARADTGIASLRAYLRRSL